MEIREVVINNKAIEKISYYAYNKDDSQMLALKNKIHAVWNNHFIDRRGYKTYIEQCFLDSSYICLGTCRRNHGQSAIWSAPRAPTFPYISIWATILTAMLTKK